MSIRVDHEGDTYEFSRDSKGKGFWVSVTGRNKYMMVPIVLGSALRQKAVVEGVDPKTFSKPEKIKTKSVRVSTKSFKKKKSGFSVSLSSIIKSVEKYNKGEGETEE